MAPGESPPAAGEADTGEQATGESDASRARPWVRGTLQSRVVWRWTDDDEDLDLYEVLSLDFGDSRRDRWTGRFSGRAAWDVDGGSNLFASVADSEGDELDFQLYDFYAETRDRGGLSRARLGRQFVYDTPVALWFDGAYLETAERGRRRWSTGVYGGIPVHQYESSSDGDWLGGLFEEFHPTRALRVRADWMHIEDERLQDEHADDVLGLGVFHDAGGRARWEARYSRLEDEHRDVSLGASWIDFERGLTLQASYYKLLEEQQSLALELDPFFESLLTLYPYDEIRASVAKSLGERVQLQGGVDLRRVEDSSDEGAFNHDFDRLFATATFVEALPGGCTVALTGENWDSDDSDYSTWGLDLSRRWKERLDASAGTFYSLYKFDPFDGSEREDVRTYYASVRYRAGPAATFQLRYEHEDQAIDDFHALRWGMTWRF